MEEIVTLRVSDTYMNWAGATLGISAIDPLTHVALLVDNVPRCWVSYRKPSRANDIMIESAYTDPDFLRRGYFSKVFAHLTAKHPGIPVDGTFVHKGLHNFVRSYNLTLERKLAQDIMHILA